MKVLQFIAALGFAMSASASDSRIDADALWSVSERLAPSSELTITGKAVTNFEQEKNRQCTLVLKRTESDGVYLVEMSIFTGNKIDLGSDPRRKITYEGTMVENQLRFSLKPRYELDKLVYMQASEDILQTVVSNSFANYSTTLLLKGGSVKKIIVGEHGSGHDIKLECLF